MPFGWRPCLLAVAAGVLIGFGFPPLRTDVGAGLGIMLLVLVCLRSAPGHAALWASMAALVGHIPSQAWIFSVSHAVGIAVPVITTISFAVAGYLIAAFYSGRTRPAGLLWLVPALFVTLETARSHILPPYLGLHSIGSTVLTGDHSIAVSVVIPIFGVHGASAIVLLSGAVGALLWPRATSLIGRIGALAIPVAVCSALSASVFPNQASEQDELSFIGVQTQSTNYTVLREFLEFANDLPRQPEIIVWPERSGLQDPMTDPDMTRQIKHVLLDVGHPIIAGFEDTRPDGGRHNAAAMWIPTGHEVIRVSQNRPDWFTGFEPGRDLGVYDLGGRNVGFVIGTDLDHESVFRRLVNQGATVILVMADDDRWNDMGSELHLTALVIRASEVGRDIGRVTRLGPSSLARNRGEDFTILPRGAEGFVSSNLVPRLGITPFVSGGWLFPYVVSGLVLLFLAMRLVRNAPARRSRTLGTSQTEATEQSSPGESR